MPTFQEFQEFDIRVGTITSAVPHPTARKPSYQLTIDFGALGRRQSSAQLTVRYNTNDLIGRQVVAVMNFPPRRVANFTSEVLVLGAMETSEAVVLLTPTTRVENGLPVA